MKYFIHESAIVDNGAVIGDGTKVWHWTHISSGSVIGKDCSIGQNVYVANDVTIGNKCKIQNNVSLFDSVHIEDEVFCGPSMVFTNVINPRSTIERKDEYKTTLVKKGSSIGANVTIVCGVTLGTYCFIGAGAVVTKDVEPYALMAGVPAKRIGWVDEEGNKIQQPPK
jgi:UDP-2-acetamido-3-amino-2,3-dideoxy-glucuronate N-acetyltransferase